jgi:hypothetical protein
MRWLNSSRYCLAGSASMITALIASPPLSYVLAAASRLPKLAIGKRVFHNYIQPLTNQPPSFPTGSFQDLLEDKPTTYVGRGGGVIFPKTLLYIRNLARVILPDYLRLTRVRLTHLRLTRVRLTHLRLTRVGLRCPASILLP